MLHCQNGSLFLVWCSAAQSELFYPKSCLMTSLCYLKAMTWRVLHVISRDSHFKCSWQTGRRKVTALAIHRWWFNWTSRQNFHMGKLGSRRDQLVKLQGFQVRRRENQAGKTGKPVWIVAMNTPALGKSFGLDYLYEFSFHSTFLQEKLRRIIELSQSESEGSRWGCGGDAWRAVPLKTLFVKKRLG